MALKTQRNDGDVSSFLASVPDDAKRVDAETLVAMMARITGCPPVLWGTNIIGFGEYRYTNTSGKEAGSFLTGFSPRKAALSFYIMPGFDGMQADLARLGPHKTGRSCLYIKRLSDIDIAVFETIIAQSVATMCARYKCD